MAIALKGGTAGGATAPRRVANFGFGRNAGWFDVQLVPVVPERVVAAPAPVALVDRDANVLRSAPGQFATDYDVVPTIYPRLANPVPSITISGTGLATVQVEGCASALVNGVYTYDLATDSYQKTSGAQLVRTFVDEVGETVWAILVGGVPWHWHPGVFEAPWDSAAEWQSSGSGVYFGTIALLSAGANVTQSPTNPARLLSQVDGGVETVTIATSQRTVTLPVTGRIRTAGASVDTWVSWVEGSLAHHASAQIDARILGKSPGTALPIFATQNHDAGIYVRNPACWAHGLAGITAISPWNSWSGAQLGNTAITPQHTICCNHAATPVTTWLRFVTATGEVVERRVVASTGQIPGTDLRVQLLNAPLPESIGFLRTIPAGVLAKLPHLSQGIPVFSTDFEEKALVSDWHAMVANSTGFQIRRPNGGQREAFYEEKIGGDSGNPTCLVVNSELLLGMVFFTGYSGATGTPIPLFTDAINARLGGTYTLTQANLSEFPSYS